MKPLSTISRSSRVLQSWVVICSAFPIALLSVEDALAQGEIVSWGQLVTPWQGELSGLLDVEAGYEHVLALRSNGTLVPWGSNGSGQCNVPPPNTAFVAMEAGAAHSLGLKSDGSIVAWGGNDRGQCNVPAPNSGFVAVAAGADHSLGLESDGSVVVWGDNSFGQLNVPLPNSGFVKLDAIGSHTL